MAKEKISLEMALSGASTVKKDINAVKDSLKTLDKHLDYVEESFKATGDQEKYLEEKSKDLNGKLEALQSIADKAKGALDQMKEAGVEPNTKAFQDMQRSVIDAQTELIKTQGELDTAGRKAGDVDDKLGGIGKNVAWDNVAEGIGKITDKLEKGARAAVNFAKKIAKSAMDSTQWAGDILKDATKYGTDAETIQRMRNVADFINTDVDTILNAKARLAKEKGTLGEALGIDADGKSVDEVFWAAGEAIMAMTDDFQKEEAAQKVFGKGWKDLVPLFTAGQEEYNRLMEEQNVLTNEQVAGLGEADDAFKKIQQQIELMKNQFWADNADKLIELGQWLLDNKDGVVTALGAIAVAFSGLKLAEGAANIMKIVSGFKELGLGKGSDGGGGGSAPTAPGTGEGGWKKLGSRLKDYGGLMGLGLIAAGFGWAGDRRNNQADQVRGTEEYLGAQSAGTEGLLSNYLRAMQAQSSLTWMEPEEQVESITQAAAKAYEELMGAQGGAEALAAYKDWRQENSYGSDYWEIPETLDKMTKAAEELSGESDGQKQSNTEMTQAANGLKGLPAEVANAIAAALNGIGISIDGQSLMAYINTHQANSVLGQ